MLRRRLESAILKMTGSVGRALSDVLADSGSFGKGGVGTHFDDKSRSVELAGRVELSSDKLLIGDGGKMWAGSDAVSTVAKSTYSQNVRLTAP